MSDEACVEGRVRRTATHTINGPRVRTEAEGGLEKDPGIKVEAGVVVLVTGCAALNTIVGEEIKIGLITVMVVAEIATHDSTKQSKCMHGAVPWK